MLSFPDALTKLINAIPSPIEEEVEISVALGRCLAENVTSSRNVPPFDKSVMDGFAVRSRDLAQGWLRLTLIGDAAAGSPCPYKVGPGEAVRIMTGAAVPAGADAVQIVEKTEMASPREVILSEPVPKGANILPMGVEIRSGAVVLESGEPVTPARIGVLAALGRASVRVYRAPSLTVVATGDELVPAGQVPAPHQIWESNTPMLLGLGRELGLSPAAEPTLPDEPAALRGFLDRHTEDDVLILSGGLSMGEKDFVHQVLKDGGARVLFHKVAVKPGKPILAAMRGRQLIFGLPGNPVSTFMTFLLFVRPALRKLMGFRELEPRFFTLPLAEETSQRPGRLFFKPARLVFRAGECAVEPIETQGSSDLAAFSRADALLKIPADCETLSAGSPVEVMVLDRGGFYR